MKNEKIELEEFDVSILEPRGDDIVCPVYTIPLNECKVKDFCRQNGIVCYLPLKKTWKYNNYASKGKQYQYKKLVLRPMFPSYVFVRVSKEQQALLWTTHKIVDFLKPISQDSFLREIRAVHACEVIGLEQEIEFNPDIHLQDHFIIESGIWSGVTGWLEEKNKRFEWTVKLELLNQYVRTTIDPSTFKMRRIDN